MAARDLVTRLVIKARDEASSVLGGVQQALSGIGVKVAAVATAIAGYFGIRLFADAVDSARGFEAQLDRVAAVSGASAEQMAALKAAAEEMGATTRYTATQAAGAMENLTRAGLSATEAITALPAVLALAQGNGIELGQAAALVTQTVKGMGLAVGESARVADVLTKAAASANTNVLGLGQALSYAAPVAQALGLSLEETAALVGKFADAGIDASRAGTALNSILSQFSDPASKFRAELAAAGITTTNFNAALHQLAEAGPAGERAMLAVGQEAGPALRALLNQGVGALDELTGKLKESSGAAQEAAATMNDNLDGAVLGLGSAWEAFKLKLADPVLGVLKDQVQAVTEVIQRFVSSGVATRFGEAISTAFQAGGKWALAFLETLDFDKLIASLKSFASEAQTTFQKIGEYSTTAGAAMQTAWGVMSAGVNTVEAAIFKIAEAFAGVSSNILSGVSLLLEGLSKITFGKVSEGFKQMVEETKLAAGGMAAVSEEFARKSSEAFDAATESAVSASEGWSKLGEQIRSVPAEFERIEPAIRGVESAALDASEAVGRLGDKAAESGKKQAAGADEARKSIAALRADYDRLIKTGDTQGAAEVLKQINSELKKTGPTSKAATAAVEQAFSALGIQSQASLKALATSAKTNFDTIKNSGVASTADLKAAFAAYAEKAIAANGGVVSEALKVEAAMNGLELATDRTGKTVVRSMAEASSATDEFGHRAKESAGAVEEIGKSVDIVTDKVEKLGEGVERVGAGFKNAQGWASTAAGNKITSTDGRSWAEWSLTELRALVAGRSRIIASADAKAAAKTELESRVGGQQRMTSLNRSNTSNQAVTTRTEASIDATVKANTYKFDLSINGRSSGSVSVLSQRDADTFDRFLRQLETSAKSAS